MKSYRDTMIIGIDHGYGNVKTAGCCFPTGISAFDDEPVFKDNLLIYQNRYYLIGEGHKAFAADKTVDEETYILTLAAMARELSFRNRTGAEHSPSFLCPRPSCRRSAPHMGQHAKRTVQGLPLPQPAHQFYLPWKELFH